MKPANTPSTKALPVRPPQQHQLLSDKPVMILVLGMHRSGTSVATRLLECLGAEQSSHLNTGNRNNPRGYFEDKDVMLFNDRELLPALGRKWQSTSAVDWSRLSEPDHERLASEAVAILRRNFHHQAALAVLKDPRIGLLLPFWLSVLDQANYDVRIVCALRDPLSIAHSLAERDGLTMTHAGLLFINYWFSIFSCIRHLPTAFLQYDEILADPSRSLTIAAETLEIPLANSTPAALEIFCQEFLDPGLRHHQTNLADLGQEPQLPPLARHLYHQLLHAAQAQDISSAEHFVRQKAKDWESLLPAFAELDHLYEQLAPQKLRANEHFAQQRGALAERITSLSTEHSTLVTRHSALVTSQANLARELAELSKHFIVAKATLTRTRRDMEMLKSSWTWWVATPVRTLLSWLGVEKRPSVKLEREAKLIKESGLFDEKYYLCCYADVAESGIDPVIHYLKYGSEESRNPSVTFNTRRYLELNPDVAHHASRINPLVHYIQFGKDENRPIS